MKTRTQAAWDAVRSGHTRIATAKLYTPSGYVADVPIHRGSVTKSLSTGQGQWSGTISVPGYEWFALLDPSTNCWLDISIAIGAESWTLGTFPILQATESTPGGLIDCKLGDWSYRRIRSEAESAFTIAAGPTVAETVRLYMSHVLPDPATTVARDDSNGATVITPVVQQSPGASVWSALTSVANQVGCVVEVPSRTSVAIRKYDPYVPYHEDITGTVTSMKATVDADALVNQVRVFMDSADVSGVSYMADKKITAGPYAWNRNGIGYGVLVETQRVTGATQALADAEAARIFDRQAGIVRRLSLDVVPQPWLEAGDVIVSRVSDTRIEQAMINTISYPLTVDSGMAITTRDALIR